MERCEVSIQDRPDKTECRLVVKMVCRHGMCRLIFSIMMTLMAEPTIGVTKTYRLTYESIEVMHALFDKNAAKNRWSISANVLRTFIEYFGVGTEQLDMYSEAGKATFTSYTEKIMDGRGMLAPI